MKEYLPPMCTIIALDAVYGICQSLNSDLVDDGREDDWGNF